jgi:hypothetical protein
VAADDRQKYPVLQDFDTMALDGTAPGSMGTALTVPATVEHRLGKLGDKRRGIAWCQAGI